MPFRLQLVAPVATLSPTGFLQASVTITISFNFFYPTLIQGLGFKGKTTILLLTVPPYILAFLTSVGEWLLQFCLSAQSAAQKL